MSEETVAEVKKFRDCGQDLYVDVGAHGSVRFRYINIGIETLNVQVTSAEFKRLAEAWALRAGYKLTKHEDTN